MSRQQSGAGRARGPWNRDLAAGNTLHSALSTRVVR
jgi:hypothetical protein